jgi:hypothetical protein
MQRSSEFIFLYLPGHIFSEKPDKNTAAHRLSASRPPSHILFENDSRHFQQGSTPTPSRRPHPKRIVKVPRSFFGGYNPSLLRLDTIDDILIPV